MLEEAGQSTYQRGELGIAEARIEQDAWSQNGARNTWDVCPDLARSPRIVAVQPQWTYSSFVSLRLQERGMGLIRRPSFGTPLFKTCISNPCRIDLLKALLVVPKSDSARPYSFFHSWVLKRVDSSMSGQCLGVQQVQ